MAGFIFGGDTGMSYEALQRKRKITDALMQQKNKPMDVANGLAQGLSSVAGALMNKKLDKREDQMRSDRQGEFTDLFGGGATPASYGAPTQAVASAMGGGGDMSQYRDAIASIESAGSGDYSAVGPTNEKLGRALGRYQIMEANIGPWSREALGREVSADEFLANPKLQDAIFDSKFGGYVQKFGPEGAAQAWFAGPGGVGKTDRKDVLGTSVGQYGQKFRKALGGAPSGSGGQSGNPAKLAQLAQFAADPLLDPSQRKIAEIMLQREMQQGDPMTQLDMQYKQAQIDKINNPAPAKRETQYVDGVGLIDKATGDVLKQYDTPAKDRPMKQGADKRWRYTDGDKEMVFPDVDKNGGNDMTESERRIFMFNSIQKQTGPAINMIEENGFNPSNMKDRFANGVLGGNWLKSQDGQMYDAAAGAWSESALRLATGAAATPEEYDRIKGMYFAQVGDTPETIEFKRAMRESYEGVLGRTLSGDQGEAPNPLMFAIEQFYNDKNGVKPDGAPEVPTGSPPAGIATPEGGFDFGQMSLPDLSQIDVLSLPREQQDEWEKRMNILMQPSEGGR